MSIDLAVPLVAVAGAVACVLLGYLLGSRRESAARRGLRERLAQLDPANRTRPGLELFLDEIVAMGKLRAAVLSDDRGLPLAASLGCDTPDREAALSSLFLIVADRLPRHGAPVPFAIVVHDDACRIVIHRVFPAGSHHFALTLFANDSALTVDAIEPCVVHLQRLLKPSPVAAAAN